MLTYDPSVSDLATPMMPVAEASVETPNENKKRTVPIGLLRDTEPEKNLDESQMAEFSSSIEEVMPGPGQMMQDEVQGSPYEQAPPQKQRAGSAKGASGSSKNPFGLTDEQWYAALAGVSAVIAYSKPIQSKLSTMVPKFLGENGDMSMTGMAVTALIAAIIFYFARQFLGDKA